MEQQPRTKVAPRNDGYFELLINQPGAMIVVVLSAEHLETLTKQIDEAATKVLQEAD